MAHTKNCNRELASALTDLRADIADGLNSGIGARSLDEIWAEGEARANAAF